MTKITFNSGVGIFKSLSSQSIQGESKIVQKHASNPFGISFKGNVIQADVFQTTSIKESSTNAIKERGKVFVSAIVGNINSFNNAIKSRLNSVVSFGRRVRDNISDFWTQAKNTEITFDLSELTRYINEKFQGEYGVSRLTKRPVSELQELLVAELAG